MKPRSFLFGKLPPPKVWYCCVLTWKSVQLPSEEKKSWILKLTNGWWFSMIFPWKNAFPISNCLVAPTSVTTCTSLREGGRLGSGCVAKDAVADMIFGDKLSDIQSETASFWRKRKNLHVELSTISDFKSIWWILSDFELKNIHNKLHLLTPNGFPKLSMESFAAATRRPCCQLGTKYPTW